MSVFEGRNSFSETINGLSPQNYHNNSIKPRGLIQNSTFKRGGLFERGGVYSKGSFPEGGRIFETHTMFQKKPVVGEKLHCHHDTRDEAKSHDDYAIGIYKPVDTAMKEKETLVGHIPIELSFLLCKFFGE